MEHVVGTDRRRRWHRRALVVAAVLVVSMGPFGFGEPAGAATVSDSDSTTLTFVTFSGVTVTCRVSGLATYDTADGSGRVFTLANRSDGLTVPECEANHILDVIYRDQDDDDVTLRGMASDSDQLELWLSRVQRNVRATHVVDFPQCNPAQSVACSLTLQTAAK
jgi:hypothetical protein